MDVSVEWCHGSLCALQLIERQLFRTLGSQISQEKEFWSDYRHSEVHGLPRQMCFKILAIQILTCFVMWSSDDYMSLSGLTQEDLVYKPITQSSDEDGSVDNLHALFESARRLTGGEIKDFGDSVFELSQVEKPSNVMSSAISIGTEEFENFPKRLTYSESDEDRNFEVCHIIL